MTDTEQKALALLNEVAKEMELSRYASLDHNLPGHRALCRAIEQHEQFKREVSQMADAICVNFLLDRNVRELLKPFILPKPDPLVEACDSAPYLASSGELAAHIRAALAKRGGKIVWETSHDA